MFIGIFYTVLIPVLAGVTANIIYDFIRRWLDRRKK